MDVFPKARMSLQEQIDTVYDSEALPKVACITCDIEMDFGGRIGTTELLETKDHADHLIDFCSEHKTPLTGFVVTKLLDKKLPGINKFRDIELHPHSHTHKTKTYRLESAKEMARCQEEWSKHFGTSATGYRAPQGVMTDSDPDALTQNGFIFNASIFPARRRGVFDYRDLPREPWLWNSGVKEIPFAATEDRSRLTLSTLKLLGKGYWKKKIDTLPNIVVIDTHLHDFATPTAFNALPIPLRIAYSRNKQKGYVLLDWLIGELKQRGYTFDTMNTVATQHLR